jgi:PAS domain S-box-containing protein
LNPKDLRPTPALPEPGVPPDEIPAGDGVVVISDGGRVLSANLQAEHVLRRELRPGADFDLAALIPPPHLDKTLAALQETRREGALVTDLEVPLTFASGPPGSAVLSISPLFDEQGEITGAILVFSPPHPSAGDTVLDRSMGVEFNHLFENLTEGVFTINYRWRITSFNRRAEAITGFKREEVLGRYCWDIFKSDLCQSECPLRYTLETGSPRMDQDVRIVGKHGAQLSILVNTSVLRDKRNRVIGAVETFRPLTQVQAASLAPAGRQEVEIKGEIIGQSAALSRLLRMLPDVAASDASVVIEGESGTGKELVAKAIHALSPRARGPFVAVNCSALAETLLESELFGHVKAAFTGAMTSKVGRFELAKGGTLFLDEIAEIKPEIQVKLLRVLEEKVFERVGGVRPIPMDARIIAATNRGLQREVKAGSFREDLFYRLWTVPLYLPPLRERMEDLPLLIDHFMERLNRKYHKKVRGIDPQVMKLFRRYSWPGNIRELRRVLEYAFVFVKGPIITASHLPELDTRGDRVSPSAEEGAWPLWEDEKVTILRALHKTGGRRQDAARLLGISRSSLWRKMKAHGIGSG